GADSLSIGDRATISNMCPEYGATAAMFYIDGQTIDYLKLTGREPEQVALVEQYAKQLGLWSSALTSAEYERALEFDLSRVVRNLPGPRTPHRGLPCTELRDCGTPGANRLEAASPADARGLMPDGAVSIVAITSCPSTSNPRNLVSAGLVPKKANELGLVRT